MESPYKLIIIRNDIHCKLLSAKLCATDDILESVTVELSVSKPMLKTVTISCIYRTPWSSIDMFIESLDKLFTDNKPKHLCLYVEILVSIC